MSRARRRRGTFLVPALLGIASLAALIVGLIGDGGFDLAAWIGLAAPLAAIGWALAARRG